MEVCEATADAHTAEWIRNFALSIVDYIGRPHFAAFVSDSTGNTLLAHQLLTALDTVPTAFSLPDVVHHLNSVVKNIGQLRYFDKTIKLTRTIVTHFNTAHACKSELKIARQGLGITRGLESVGKTRFVGIVKSACSVQRCIPALEHVARRNRCNLEGISEYFRTSSVTNRPTPTACLFYNDLDDLLAITTPASKILTCLEGDYITLADVFVTWHAFLNTTLTVLKDEDHVYPMRVKENVVSILNFRYSELYVAGGRLYSPAYLAMAYLHPGVLIYLLMPSSFH
ncbi:hypothetical protein FISHEDRAFT_51107 [Fistulina hepatica ATCC 64428]|uniref:DUF659 domain-containing protein n=1 Tax=Fistulina hepatica ATCC 64428 TaxID=1128425 RepID=A0A0D7A0L9_9AGAR|nr:hypothetical protein FISHEDRAFT_51107 [Fistulina hepatica ATCC 64428]